MKNKPLPLIRLFALMIFGLVLNLSSFSQPNWSYLNTGVNHTIIIQDGIAYLNGSPIEVGDYIGVFYTDGTNLVCGGYAEYTGAIVAVTAWGDDGTTPDKDGFETGENFNWKIWDASTNMDFDAEATYISSFPNQGTYIHNGMSGLVSLMTSSEIFPLVTNISCNGLTDGAIDITVNFGTAPYTYIWSNGATTEDLTNLAPGSYSVTVTDALAVSHSLNLIVNEPLELVANIMVNENNSFMCEAFAQAFPLGGTWPYSFIWDDPNSQTTPLASDLCPGTYNVTITDGNACQVDTTIIIDPNSTTVTDTAFTLFDTCLLNNAPDTAYISNLYYSASSMSIEWTIIEGATTHIITTNYYSITSPGIYYVYLVINCNLKFISEISLVSIIEIDHSVFNVGEIEEEKFACVLHPNPIKDDLNIHAKHAISNVLEVEIYNSIGGQILKTQIDLSLNKAPKIALPGLSPGVYFAKFFNEYNQSTVVKFVK